MEKMRTIIKTIKAFKFNELKPEIQEKVLDNFRDINLEFDFNDNQDLFISDILDKYGLSAEYMYYDIYSKGSYAYFNNLQIENEDLFYKALDLKKYLTAIKLIDSEAILDISLYEKNNLNLSEVSIESETENFEEMETEIYEHINNFLESIDNELLKALREQYEYLTSDEAIKETIEANEYEFNENGDII